jgi:hypothetical protein
LHPTPGAAMIFWNSSSLIPPEQQTAHTDFTTRRGLPNESFFSDAFIFAPKTPAA